MNGGTKIFHAPSSLDLSPKWTSDQLTRLMTCIAEDKVLLDPTNNAVRAGHPHQVQAATALASKKFQEIVKQWDNPEQLKAYLDKVPLTIRSPE